MVRFLMLAIIAFLICTGPSFGKNYKKWPETKRNENGIAYKVMCLEGYKYIYISNGRRGYIAPKFNENRQPEKCYQRKNYGKRVKIK